MRADSVLFSELRKMQCYLSLLSLLKSNRTSNALQLFLTAHMCVCVSSLQGLRGLVEFLSDAGVKDEFRTYKDGRFGVFVTWT
jgi:hypothetical protein